MGGCGGMLGVGSGGVHIRTCPLIEREDRLSVPRPLTTPHLLQRTVCTCALFAVSASPPLRSTWHNGVYVHKDHAPAQFLTRQGRVHARVGVSWAQEFKTLLRVPLTLGEE